MSRPRNVRLTSVLVAVALLLPGAPALRADGFHLGAAVSAQTSAAPAVRAHVDGALRAITDGTRQGFEALRQWLAAPGSGAPASPDAAAALAALGGGTLLPDAGPYAEALRTALAAVPAPAGGDFAAAHQAAQGAAIRALEQAASAFWTSHDDLLSTARWEAVFEALDTGFVPAGTLGPSATAFLRTLGVPPPGSESAARVAENVLAGQIRGLAGGDATTSRVAALRHLYHDPNRHCPAERELPEAAWSAECQAWQPPPGGDVVAGPAGTAAPGEDPFNVIHQLDLASAGSAATVAGNLPPAAFVTVPLDTKPGGGAPPPGAPRKLHPRLEQMIAELGATERIEVLVNLRDSRRVPRFPEHQATTAGPLLASAEGPPSVVSPTAAAAGAPDRGATMAAAEALVEQLRAARQPTYQRLQQAWGAAYGVEVLQTYWLIQAMLVEMPVGRVGALSELDEVLFLEPRFTLEQPPADANNANDVEDGRARVRSDPYFNAVAGRVEFVALLDTGVRFSHTLFAAPSRFLIREDCTGADGACDANPNPADDHWNHGTSSAGIVIGNSALGGAFRGVTAFYLDSYKIYDNTGLDTAATVLAFQRAVATLNRVIVGEIQSAETDTGAIATAADAAFDAGAVVISANGNFGPGAGSVRSPGIAHKVLGVGAVDVQTAALQNYQGRGPAPDGRIKPDLQAPTNTETASNASDTALQVFTGTSGATPYAAAAGALARNWLRRGSATGSIDPGQVYAYLLLGGTRPYPFTHDHGAGLLEMPTGGRANWGKVAVANGATVEIPITVAAGQRRFGAAIWWPETAAQNHNDVDLWLVDPAGTVRARSSSIPSVFEKVRVDGTLAAGVWKVQIRGFNVPVAPQTVYWATHVRN